MLRLAESTVRALVAHASREPDREVCGLVWATEHAQVVHPLPNIHSEPATYYRTAPKDVRAAFDTMDEDGGKPLAWYHSHPGGKPDPSEEDMRGAFNTGMYYLIVYPQTSKPARDALVTEWQVSAWECLEAGVLVQVGLE